MNKEIYKEIPGFPGYLISESGNIFSNKRKKFISHAFNWAGYKVATITNSDGYRAPQKIHRLVYSAFIGKLDKNKVIDHIDNNRLNNHYTNLRQITASENSRKSFISGKNKSKRVWTKKIVNKICKMLEKQYSIREIFKELNIKYDENNYKYNRIIRDIINKRFHKDVSSNFDLNKYCSSINKKDVKLTINSVKEIYIGVKFENIKPSYFSKKYKVKHSTICKIRDKKTWTFITDKIDNDWEVMEFNDYLERE